MKKFRRFFLLLAAAGVVLMATNASGQGCVAAHSDQRPFAELIAPEPAPTASPSRIHNLTVNIGYRVFNSNKYFVGSTEIARPTAVENHQNIFDIGMEYQLNPRWSILADIPVFNGTRNQIYPPSGIFQVSGLGDVTVGVQRWMFRPPTESGGNVALNMQLKMPTGIDDATGSATLKGQTVKATADPSLQPGDGTWAFSVGGPGLPDAVALSVSLWTGQLSFQPRGYKRRCLIPIATWPGGNIGDRPVSLSRRSLAARAQDEARCAERGHPW